MSPDQCRAARAWLNWSQDDLAKKAKVSGSTIRDFEVGRRVPHPNNLAAIRLAFETAHITFAYADDGTPLGVAPDPTEQETQTLSALGLSPPNSRF